MIGHPDERDVERWRSSDAAVMRAELDRALGRHAGSAADIDVAKELTRSDAELIEAVRAGAVEAYGQLYARHVTAARNLARQLSRSLCAGGGPESAFRAYLLTALRHTAYDKTPSPVHSGLSASR